MHLEQAPYLLHKHEARLGFGSTSVNKPIRVDFFHIYGVFTCNERAGATSYRTKTIMCRE